MKQFDRAKAGKSPLPCQGTVATCGSPFPCELKAQSPGKKRVSPVFAFRSVALESCAETNRGPTSVAPPNDASNGAANSRKVAADEIGFPGSPKNGNLDPAERGTSPKTSGFPG